MTKKLHLPADEIKPLATGLGTCIVTDKITVQGLPVRFMYREGPIGGTDSGWRFLAGTESDAYMENANNQGAFDVNIVANIDPSIIPFLNAPVGAAFEKFEEGGDFQEAGDWEPDED
ncbi:MAG TPA: DUF2185 domain-containing protein [Candidatus Aquabacterium excrementipullorum]|nr:DUF2185 domain-containing protein [Candidatus Aquabacterium excrementipullorum]